MKLYHLSQNVNNDYDTYSDMVVCAESEEDARQIHPAEYRDDPWRNPTSSDWANTPEQVKVIYLGEADPSVEEGVVCSSFHAG